MQPYEQDSSRPSGISGLIRMKTKDEIATEENVIPTISRLRHWSLTFVNPAQISKQTLPVDASA